MLYQSGPVSTTQAVNTEPVTINVGGIPVTAGLDYVIFFTTTLDQTGITPGTTGPFAIVASTSYTGGNVVFLNNGNNPTWTTTPWGNYAAADFAFDASFA